MTMAVQLTFTVEPDGFPFATTFLSHPEATIELERIIPTHEWVTSYVWVRGIHDEARPTLDNAHSDVVRSEFIDSVNHDHLFRIDWDTSENRLLTGLHESNVTLLSATGTNSGWTFEIRGDDREAIAAFNTYCDTYDVPITIVEIHELVPSRSKYDLTDTQLEALRHAYERGYFDSPRTATLEDIATELGISRQALSSRLRRGHKHLIERTILNPEERNK